jgi:hypothetical protein
MMKTGLQRQEENIKFLRRYLTLKGCTYYRYLSILHMNVYLVTYGCVTNIEINENETKRNETKSTKTKRNEIDEMKTK